MTKKNIVKKYLLENVNFESLKNDYSNSWLKNKPFEWLQSNGITSKHFYKHQLKAIELAGYKNPKSDRTWITVLNVQNEILNEKRYYLQS